MAFNFLIDPLFIQAVSDDPFETIDHYLMNQPYMDTRREMLEMLLSASGHKKAGWIRRDPGTCLWHYHQFAGLVMAVYRMFQQKLWNDPTLNLHVWHHEKVASAGTNQLCQGVGLHHLSDKEFVNPGKVFKKAFLHLELEQWLDFIHNCIMNTLSWRYGPEWYDVPGQVHCTIYTFKILDAAYLINSRLKKPPVLG